MSHKIVLHAPTANALARARSNLKNLLLADRHLEIRIVANAGGVKAALENPDRHTDVYLSLCANTLKMQELTAPEGFTIVPSGAHACALLQAEGWLYIRA